MNAHIIRELNQAIALFRQNTDALILRIEPDYYIDIKKELIRLIDCLTEELESVKNCLLTNLEQQRHQIISCPDNICTTRQGIYCPHTLQLSLRSFQERVEEYPIPNPTTRKFFEKTSMEILLLAKPVLHRFRDIHRAAIYRLYRELNYPGATWFHPIPSAHATTGLLLTDSCTATQGASHGPHSQEPGAQKSNWQKTSETTIKIAAFLYTGIFLTFETHHLLNLEIHTNLFPPIDLKNAYNFYKDYRFYVFASIAILILFAYNSPYKKKLFKYIIYISTASTFISTVNYNIQTQNKISPNQNQAQGQKSENSIGSISNSLSLPEKIDININSNTTETKDKITTINTELSSIHKTINRIYKNIRQTSRQDQSKTPEESNAPKTPPKNQSPTQPKKVGAQTTLECIPFCLDSGLESLERALLGTLTPLKPPADTKDNP